MTGTRCRTCPHDPPSRSYSLWSARGFSFISSSGGDYGFHRDELATIDDARYLAAGYVAYPPVTPLIGRLAQELFGDSLRGFRLFSALAQATAMLFTGLMASELGASRGGQALAALAAGVAPVAMMAGVLFQYVAFDYLWWVLIAFARSGSSGAATLAGGSPSAR